SIRVRWLRGPLGRDLVALAGGVEGIAPAEAPESAASRESTGAPGTAASDDIDRRILHLLTGGLSNREMAESLGVSEADLAQRLAQVLGRLGATSRAEATTLAFRGLVPASGLVAATQPLQ